MPRHCIVDYGIQIETFTKMHSNYFVYQIPPNGHSAQIASTPITHNTNVKNVTISHQNTNVARNAIAQHHTVNQNGMQHTATTQLITPKYENYAAQQPENSFRCDTCGQSFAKESSLKRHVSRMHNAIKAAPVAQPPSDNSPFKCNACKVDYLNAPTFEHHIKTEHGQPQIQKCTDCGCFRPVTVFNNVPFRCEQCTRRKSQYQNSGSNYRTTGNNKDAQAMAGSHVKAPQLDMDILIQTMKTGEPSGRRRKMHQCPNCDKCYKHQSTLAMHKKTHTGEYKFKCEYCDKEFYLAEYYVSNLLAQK